MDRGRVDGVEGACRIMWSTHWGGAQFGLMGDGLSLAGEGLDLPHPNKHQHDAALYQCLPMSVVDNSHSLRAFRFGIRPTPINPSPKY